MSRSFYMTTAAPVVETAKGALRGFYFKGVYHFYGVRYAKARRFQMPEPVEAWEGVRDADSYGMICPVLSAPQPVRELLAPHRFWPASEHCQYLNIWTDRCDGNAKKPVMFWIHGGGFSAGSSIEQEAYDGYNLAKDYGVVVVSVNHRLNAFGYLDLSDFGAQYANSVNVGMADLVEALRWVRDNIACFGGDPDNVTVFGQSGGGAKVTVLGQIPEARGLFHKAIVMSGVIPAGEFDSECQPKELVRAILAQLRIPEGEAERLEKVPVPQFIWAVNRASAEFQRAGRRVDWGPKPNGYYVCDPLEGAFTEFACSVPTMVGSVIAEFAFSDGSTERAALSRAQRERAVLEYYGAEGGQKLLEAFRWAYPGKNEVYATDLDLFFLPPTLDYVKKKAAVSGAPVYNYLFAKVFDCLGGKAAWHCSDIPFFFHNAERIPVCRQRGWRTLDRVMSGAFVSFARSGDPNVEGLPHWDPCGPDRTVTMVFDDECRCVEGLQDALLPLLQAYSPKPSFDFTPPEDEDEESGTAWVF